MMKVAVVDYNSGNLASAARALERAAHWAEIDAEIRITADADDVAAADRVVLPGQGAFADCAAGLAAVPGMWETVARVTATGRPFLGICVGMQLMAERGLEHGVTPGFGWIKGEIALMEKPGLRLPQMGWNGLDFEPGRHMLLHGLMPDDHAYFVHSYALRGGLSRELLATTDYGGPVTAIAGRDNLAGTQFHVEKSQDVGLRMLANFLRWKP
jgi:glutamine amidotransferase